jgi:DNA-binding NtrC family response regulator
MVEYFWRSNVVLPSQPNGHGQMATDLVRTGKISFPQTAVECGSRYEGVTAQEGKASLPATVLVAEDDNALRKLLTNGLRREGYQILSAADGLQAIQLAELHNGPIDALVADVKMPHALGTEVARRLKAKWPQLRVICMSGCLQEGFDTRQIMASGWSFLQKPFSLNQLCRTLRATLEQGDRLRPRD